MRSISRVAALIACGAAAAMTWGCSSFNVHSSGIRGIAYVNLDDVVKRDPLYSQLSQIDDAIAMVELVGAGPRVPHTAAEIARDSAQLRAQIGAAQQRIQSIVAQKQQTYAARARAAVTSALAAAGVKNPADVAAAMGAVSQQQQQQAQIQAGRDLMAYRQTVVQQSTATARGIVRQLQQEAAQKLQAKAQQEQQAESNLALRLSQQDAPRRLAIQTRLSMLALGQSERQKLQAQLSQIASSENAAIAAQRSADEREYTAYRTQVETQTTAAIHAQLGTIQSQTQAKLIGRRNAVVAQLRSVAPVPSASIAPATRAQIRQIVQQLQDQYTRDVQDAIAQYEQTQAALEVQYAMLHGADAEASTAAQQEVALLQQRRQTLYDQIVNHIRTEAERLAKEKGFDVVFSDVTAAAGGYNMTNELISDIESEHE
jgi:hypothetical protein